MGKNPYCTLNLTRQLQIAWTVKSFSFENIHTSINRKGSKNILPRSAICGISATKQLFKKKKKYLLPPLPHQTALTKQ